MYSLIRNCRPRIFIAFFLLSPLLTNAFGQRASTDYFPKYTFDLNWSPFYLSFIQPLGDDNNFNPIFGAGFGYELFQINGGKAIYGVLQFDSFLAKAEGKDIVEWQRTDIDLGLRLSFAMSFMNRPNAKFFIGSGYSRLRLKKRDARYERMTERIEGRLIIRYNDVSIITKWRDHGVFLEAGQIIPFDVNHAPLLNMTWTLKYEQPLAGSELNLGGVSFAFGFGFTLSYSQ